MAEAKVDVRYWQLLHVFDKAEVDTHHYFDHKINVLDTADGERYCPICYFRERVKYYLEDEALEGTSTPEEDTRLISLYLGHKNRVHDIYRGRILWIKSLQFSTEDCSCNLHAEGPYFTWTCKIHGTMSYKEYKDAGGAKNHTIS